ncbi:MAG: amidohydrolase family protein [Deltaproteobacteria bacterium]|nr:amidohydrolase family protein [Candidatus Zymogenaceae bacterium]
MTKNDKIPPDIIDFHVHLFPDRLFDAIWKYFSRDYGWDVLHRFYWRQCIDYLRNHNVGPIVFSTYAHKKGVARMLNDWSMKVLESDPDLYYFAAYHPDDEDGPALAREVLSHPRVLGFKLQLLVQRFYPHDERLFPLYDLVMEQAKRILLHVGNGPAGNEFVGLANFEKLMRRYRELSVNVAHMGGFEFGGFFGLLPECPNLMFDTAFAFLKGLGHVCDVPPEDLERHRDRIVYGSDFPNIIFPREEEIDYLLDLGLSDEFYRKVFWENGMRIIGEQR